MDCFYAAVEMRDNPELQTKPIAVGGKSNRGVLSTCNYIARQYGVRSAMPNHMAKKLCPDLIIVNGRMEVYQQVSAIVREIFARYTDKIEPLSLDEAYLDVSESEAFGGSATLIAEQIRQDIFNETQLTASAGVAPNKFLAKIASDENKPNGLCVVTPENVATFVKYLPLTKIPGIGPKTASRLREYGLETAEDVRLYPFAQLQSLMGKQATSLFNRCHGRDDSEVKTHRERKSLAVETTLSQDIESLDQVLAIMNSLTEKLKSRYLTGKSKEKEIAKLGVKLKFSDFCQTTAECQAISIQPSVFESLFEIAIQRAQNRRIRLVGLSIGFASNKAGKDENKQLTLAF